MLFAATSTRGRNSVCRCKWYLLRTLATLLVFSSRSTTEPTVLHIFSSTILASAAVMVPPPASASTTVSGTSCAIVGVGVLGTSLARQMLDSPDFPQLQTVTGITKSQARHESIREQVGHSSKFKLLTSEEFMKQTPQPKFDNVVFCAPPSGFEDYPASVKEAIDIYWAGPESGVFVFTSSGAVYGEASGIVTEETTTADPTGNPRIARLVSAELECLNAGGCCLRLAGLYDLNRGAHNYWLTSGKPVPASSDGLINLLHYQDAAGACLAAIKAGPVICTGKVFLISDGKPLSRYSICEIALKAKVYQGYVMPEFTGTEREPWAKAKVFDGTSSMKMLDWKPIYTSFEDFMTSNS